MHLWASSGLPPQFDPQWVRQYHRFVLCNVQNNYSARFWRGRKDGTAFNWGTGAELWYAQWALQLLFFTSSGPNWLMMVNCFCTRQTLMGHMLIIRHAKCQTLSIVQLKSVDTMHCMHTAVKPEMVRHFKQFGNRELIQFDFLNQAKYVFNKIYKVPIQIFYSIVVQSSINCNTLEYCRMTLYCCRWFAGNCLHGKADNAVHNSSDNQNDL